MGDPPRKLATRLLRFQIHPRARILYLAHYHMNVSTPATRQRFLARVDRGPWRAFEANHIVRPDNATVAYRRDHWAAHFRL